MDRRREGMDKEREGDNNIERGFLLFEILWLRMYSLENSESRRLSVLVDVLVSFSFAFYSFYRPKVAQFPRDLTLSVGFRAKHTFGLLRRPSLR